MSASGRFSVIRVTAPRVSISRVWRAGPNLLKVYGGLGLTALPLGADGLLLPESCGDTPVSELYLCCVAERDLATLIPQLPVLAGVALEEAAE